MKSQKYNGWTNWDTWNCNLWMTNDEYSERQMRRCKSVEELRNLWVEGFNNPDNIELDEINFDEIFSYNEEWRDFA